MASIAVVVVVTKHRSSSVALLTSSSTPATPLPAPPLPMYSSSARDLRSPFSITSVPVEAPCPPPWQPETRLPARIWAVVAAREVKVEEVLVVVAVMAGVVEEAKKIVKMMVAVAG